MESLKQRILESREKSWDIVEKRPIKATVKKNKHGDWDLIVGAMLMSYDTYNDLTMSFLDDEMGGYTSYDYKTGVPELSFTDKGIKALKKKKSHIIEIS